MPGHVVKPNKKSQKRKSNRSSSMADVGGELRSVWEDKENHENQRNLTGIAENELNEKPEWRDKNIQLLRELLLANPDLYAPTDDKFLLKFLRARKFDVNRAYVIIQQYYAIRANNFELFSGLVPSNMTHVYEDNMQMMLPDRDQHGRRVFVFRPGAWDPDKYDVGEIFRANLLCIEKAAEEEETQICGLVSICDLKNFTFYQARHCTPSWARRFVLLVQECLPLRFKGFHFVNEPLLFNAVFMLARPFLNEKIRSRVFFHGSNMKSLQEHVPARILPAEFSGEMPPMDNATFIRGVMKMEDHYEKAARFGYRNNLNGKVVVKKHSPSLPCPLTTESCSHSARRNSHIITPASPTAEGVIPTSLEIGCEE